MQLRDYLPKTLFGRMLSIILVPMILVQVITMVGRWATNMSAHNKHCTTKPHIPKKVRIAKHDLLQHATKVQIYK